MPEQVTYLHRVCSRIVDALKGVPQYWLEDPRLQPLFPFSAAEQAWIREAWGSIARRGVNPLYGRLDAVCDFTGARWQDSLQFLEPNLSGVGGIQMGPLADSLVMRDVVPTILAYDPGLDIELPRDQRDLFLQVLLDHARAIGASGNNICLVEPKYIQEGPNEQSALARYLAERHGVTVVHADPRELRLAGDEVWYGDTRVDVAYRDYEVRDLLALEREDGRELDAMRALFRQNRMVSSVGGEFDHKACWELLTDDELAATYYSATERRMFRRHVLWTRVLSPRVTMLPEGDSGDLPEFARRRREELVLKPNRGYGGTGIRIGSLTSAGEWDALIERALRTHEDPDGSWVVQSVANLPVHEFPVVDADGRAHAEPFYAVMGFTPTDNGLAMLCRVSQRQVVNVAQRGGLAPVLIGHRPRDLRAPMRAAVGREHAARRTGGADPPAARSRCGHQSPLLGRGDVSAGRRARARAASSSAPWRACATSCWWTTGSAISSRRSPPIAATPGAPPRSSTSCVACGASRSRCRTTSWARSQRRARPRSPAGSARARRRTTPRSPRRSPGCSSWCASAPQALQRTSDLYDGLLDEHEPGMTPRAPRSVAARRRPETCATRAGARGAHRRLARRSAARPLPDGAPGRVLQGAPARHGLRLRARSLRPVDAPVHAAGRRGRRAAHDPRLRGRPALGRVRDAARGRPRALRPGVPRARCTARCSPRRRAWACTSRSRACGRTTSGAAADSGCTISRASSSSFPRRSAERMPRASTAPRTSCKPGTNRVEADEATYNLHILMRYELEIALLAGDLGVAELPEAWNAQSRKWLGVAPASLREGCLQDVHWSLGSFGYFPTYTIGNLYAAQLVEAYRRAGHDLDAELRAGRLQVLRGWLAANVYAPGRAEQAEAIVRRVTGEGLAADSFFRLLEARFDEAAG